MPQLLLSFLEVAQRFCPGVIFSYAVIMLHRGNYTEGYYYLSVALVIAYIQYKVQSDV